MEVGMLEVDGRNIDVGEAGRELHGVKGS